MTEAANEATIKGVHYKFGKLAPKTQFHVARRLSPILGAIVTHVRAGGQIKPEDLSAEDLKSLAPMIDAIASLDDAAVDYILDNTLAVVEMEREGRWARITAANGSLMFDDIDMPTMLQLAWGVIAANLTGFF